MEDRRHSKIKKHQEQLVSDYPETNNYSNTDFNKNIRTPVIGVRSRLRKKLASSTNKISRIIIPRMADLTNHSIPFEVWTKSKKKLLHKLKELPSPSSIPGTLLSIPFFSRYQTCTILIHEKGRNNSIVHTSNIQNEQLSFDIPVNEFNLIHSYIRKSKNKTFHVNNLDALKAKEFQKKLESYTGTFLAEEISLPNNNIVIMASRNDFLPPLQEELLSFHTLINLLPRYLQIIIEKQSVINKNRYKSTCLSQTQNHNFDTPDSTSDLFHFQRIALLGELLNTLKHELSNPLFGLKLSAELLLHDNETICDDNKMFLMEIDSNIIRCQDIIGNFSKIYTDTKTLTLIPLRKHINEAFILAKSEIRDLQKEISFCGFDDNDPIMVVANPTWIIQILFNLLINSSQAIKNSNQQIEHPTISITVNTCKKDNEEFLTIDVEDNGPGISEAQAKQLFTPFFTTKKKGTGLGLAICRNLAHKMNGEVVLQHNIQKVGASFRLYLPNTTLSLEAK